MEFQSDITEQDVPIHLVIKASIRVEHAMCGNLAVNLIAILFESTVKYFKPLKTFTKFTKFYITIYIHFYIIIL